MEQRDPTEFDPKYKEIFSHIDKEVRQELGGPGYHREFWTTKKRILKEKYGADWKTPAEMNPTIESNQSNYNILIRCNEKIY